MLLMMMNGIVKEIYVNEHVEQTMGELATGGGAFIAAAGGCWLGRGRRIPGEGGGVIWPVDIPEGEGALFGTKGRALGSLCHTK